MTTDDIITLLNKMGGLISYEDDDIIICNTICHNGNKPKLYYYKESKMFHCYTECGQMSIFDLVMHYKEYKDNEFYKAINWICITLNIDNCEYGFGIDNNKNLIKDWDFINNYKKQIKNSTLCKTFDMKKYDNNVLNLFHNYYTSSWLNDGISVITMKKYNIKYCIWKQNIIIPHYNMANNLIGIRVRNLIDYMIDMYGKYTPLKLGQQFYTHELGKNLYGLNNNYKAIKRKKKIMLVEAEKSVMQVDTMFGDNNFTVALCGSNLTEYQKQIILDLGVKEVIIALDKQYKNLESEECKKWAKHIKDNIISKLLPYVSIYVVWDTTNLLDYKDSPTDKGKDVLLKLMKTKIFVPTSN